MTADRDFDRITTAWLADGPEELSDRVLSAVADEIHVTRQRHGLRLPWRSSTMTTPARLAAAAVIGVLAVGTALYAISPGMGSGAGGPGPNPTPTASPTPTPTASPTPTEGFGSAEALAVVDAYFVANAAADFEALRALFTPDATIDGDFNIADEMVFAWNVAQGTKLSEPDCNFVNEVLGESATVTCKFFNLDTLVQAVDGSPVPITLRLTVTRDGISKENGSIGEPDFDLVQVPFERWMSKNHPEDLDKVGFGEWASIEEAELWGALRAQYAEEWATYLAANGCKYLQNC